TGGRGVPAGLAVLEEPLRNPATYARTSHGPASSTAQNLQRGTHRSSDRLVRGGGTAAAWHAQRIHLFGDIPRFLQCVRFPDHGYRRPGDRYVRRRPAILRFA